MTEMNVLRNDSFSVKAVALCGGKGTRLRGVGSDIPKPLVRVAGKPLIDYSIDIFLSAGITDFYFAAGYLSEMIQKHVIDTETQKGMNSNFYIEEPVGIVHALTNTLKTFDVTGPIVVFDTDVIRNGLDFNHAYNFHEKSKAKTTLVCTKINQAKSSHFIVLSDKDMNTQCIALLSENEMVDNAIIKCGMIICSPEITELIKNNDDIPNSWIGLLEYISTGNDTKTYITPEPIMYSNVNTPEDLYQINQSLNSSYKT